MAKTRKEKESIVLKLSEQMGVAKSAVIVNYKGLTVSETEELRNELQKNEVSFSIAKNSLLKIVLKNRGIVVDNKILNQPLAIALSRADEVSAAKGIGQFQKGHENLEILGGIFEKEYIDKDRVMILANLPSQLELYARAVSSIASPLSGLVTVLSGNIRGLVNVINQYKTSKEAN